MGVGIARRGTQPEVAPEMSKTLAPQDSNLQSLLTINTEMQKRNSIGTGQSNRSKRVSSRKSDRKIKDLNAAKMIVNSADEHLGYEQTYKIIDISEESVKDGIRISKTVAKRPSQLRASVSRASRRDGTGSACSQRGG